MQSVVADEYERGDRGGVSHIKAKIMQIKLSWLLHIYINDGVALK